MRTQAVDEEELLVHTWRVARLTQLGVSGSLAEVYADRLDWHQVARLARNRPRPWPGPCTKTRRPGKQT